MNQNEFNEINEEETNNEDDWEELKADKDYLININYPHQIKKKSTGNIVSENIGNHGYYRCKLNGKDFLKHRLIALQWLENPENLPQIDHRNGVRTDNRIENLRYVNNSQNGKNKTRQKKIKYNYLDELPESAEQLDSYNGHDFDGLYIDYENEKLYIFNGVRYRELLPIRQGGNIYYHCYNIENKISSLAHKVLFG